jgi:hypothetical protein
MVPVCMGTVEDTAATDGDIIMGGFITMAITAACIIPGSVLDFGICLMDVILFIGETPYIITAMVFITSMTEVNTQLLNRLSAQR